MKIAILTDSCLGGDPHKYSNMTIIPLMITKEDGTQIYDDENFNKDDFYNLLEKEALKTSQTITGDVINAYDKMLEKYDQVVVMLLSKGLSGQYQTALMLANEEKYKNKIFVVDTNGVSIVMEHLIDRVYDFIEQGLNGTQIKEKIESLNNKFVGFIIPKNLKTLVRGGRISKAAAGFAKLLKINPILRYNGQIDKFSKERTFKKAVRLVLAQIQKEIPGITQIDLTYSRSPKETIDLVHGIINDSGLIINLERDLSNVIAAHTGTETFAFIAWMKEE
ncbi:DegV family protein [Spiroplasma endosymbiont of Labia minor]|uniref:DegV family protein n=1 Tax=Spiroplasma endosymbiont of Labia minor TaxID=3066305 RepID=UPI0030CFA49F